MGHMDPDVRKGNLCELFELGAADIQQDVIEHHQLRRGEEKGASPLPEQKDPKMRVIVDPDKPLCREQVVREVNRSASRACLYRFVIHRCSFC